MKPSLQLIPTTIVPGISSISVSNKGSQSLGRDPACSLQLSHPAVSRRHAGVEYRQGAWWVTDLGSRHGTMLNGKRIDPSSSEILRHGDSLALPPLVFRVDLGEGPLPVSAATCVDSDENKINQIERVSKKELGALAAMRLDLLIDAAGAIAEARDDAQLIEVVLAVLKDGTGLGRSAILRSVDATHGLFDVLSSNAPDGAETRPYSRTLMNSALTGEIVRLNDEPDFREAVSIVGSGVQQAICAPVLLDGEVQLLLYVDAVESGTGESDAAAFTAAIARLCGLALSNLKRVDLEVRQEHLLQEMRAARNVQEKLMPATEGSLGRLEYVVHSQPGRVVAGDLFGIHETHDGRVALYLGDVAGKGVGAGMLMASIQAALTVHFQSQLASHEIVAKLNEYVAEHSSESEFATLFLVVLDTKNLHAALVDAGHGYAAIIRDGVAIKLESDGGPPVGAVNGMEYGVTNIEFQEGDRLVLYSDGVAEQQNPDGEEFGIARTFAALEEATTGDEDIQQVMSALKAFAQCDHFADDVTLASTSIRASD